MSVQIQGLTELNRKLMLMKENFAGRRLNTVLMDAARPIRDQAKRNARVGPTGKTRAGVTMFAGKKAFKFGALVVVKAKWKGSAAVFEEWGTKERIFNVMKVPLSKLAATGGKSRARLGGKKSERFGFLFFRKAAPMKGTRFFENAVEERSTDAFTTILDGCREIIQESIR